jgi:hypothetical protein
MALPINTCMLGFGDPLGQTPTFAVGYYLTNIRDAALAGAKGTSPTKRSAIGAEPIAPPHPRNTCAE